MLHNIYYSIFFNYFLMKLSHKWVWSHMQASRHLWQRQHPQSLGHKLSTERSHILNAQLQRLMETFAFNCENLGANSSQGRNHSNLYNQAECHAGHCDHSYKKQIYKQWNCFTQDTNKNFTVRFLNTDHYITYNR